jgi:hypothetical protein
VRNKSTPLLNASCLVFGFATPARAIGLDFWGEDREVSVDRISFGVEVEESHMFLRLGSSPPEDF